MNLLGYIREKFAKEKYFKATRVSVRIRKISILLEKVPQDLHSVYFEYDENCTHGRLLYAYYALCQTKRLIKTSEPVYAD